MNRVELLLELFLKIFTRILAHCQNTIITFWSSFLRWKKADSTWSKLHYCVPNFFFPILSRESNLSKRKYIRDELVLFAALSRNLNFVSFDVFKSQYFSTTSKKCAQKIICSLTWTKTWFQLISLFEGAYMFVIEEKKIKPIVEVCENGEETASERQTVS